jgi:hypothetical protein
MSVENQISSRYLSKVSLQSSKFTKLGKEELYLREKNGVGDNYSLIMTLCLFNSIEL